jgi:hypothetical protein
VELRGALSVEGEAAPVDLVVRYPDSFPYFRPEVYAPGLDLGRHQNPFEHNLCLLDRSTRAWSTAETAAHLVATQVPYLLSLLRAGGETLREAEVPQGEPLSYYFPIQAGTFVLIPEELLHLPHDEASGVGRIATVPDELTQQLRGVMLSASARRGGGRSEPLATAAGPLADRFGAARSVEVRWVRIAHAPGGRDPEAVLTAGDAALEGFSRPQWQTAAGGQIAVNAVVFSEEVEQGVFGDQWLFVVRIKRRQGRVEQQGAYLTRGERYSQPDLHARVPQLTPLAQRRVALVGLGSLGAPIATELVRSGLAELRCLDYDLVEAGTTVRWPFGLSAVNAPKADFLAQTLGREYPLATVTPFQWMLGEVRRVGSATDFDLLYRMFDGVDLVIESSGEIGLQQFVSSVADELGIPQLFVWATEGARGGVVALRLPGVTGCWHCLQLGIAAGALPSPARDEMGTVQPRGCGSRTFTGSSFDLAPIWAHAARVASSALASGTPAANAVFVCSLDGGVSPEPPQWQAVPLPQQEDCPCCGRAKAAA